MRKLGGCESRRRHDGAIAPIDDPCRGSSARGARDRICARQDLIDIWRYIAPNDLAAADALLDRIDEKCALLARHPRLGVERSDIRPGLRYLVVGAYLILYRIIEDGIEVVRVVHGRRDLFNLL